ncbi:MAG: GyrI-like domain-containing protein [Eubacteriales bacterium]
MNKKTLEIKIIETIDTPIVSIREKTAVRNFDILMGKAYDLLNKSGAISTGTPIAIYYSPDFDPEDTDMEIGYPVSSTGDHTNVLKGCTCASAVHTGEYSRLHETYMKIGEWIESHGYTISGPPYEIYLNDPHEVEAEELRTEVYFPIRK